MGSCLVIQHLLCSSIIKISTKHQFGAQVLNDNIIYVSFVPQLFYFWCKARQRNCYAQPEKAQSEGNVVIKFEMKLTRNIREGSAQ